MDRAEALMIARLARWLGPWTDDAARPEAVDRREVRVEGEEGDRSFPAWVYKPAGRPPVGSLLVLPGLHYAGPADPRFDRFCAVLADAGILVLAPFLPDYGALRVAPTVPGDADRALEALLRLPDRPTGAPPGVFSISFGSWPALRLATDPRRSGQVASVVTFGGYADFRETIRFCLTGGGGLPHDPLNRPVLFLNVLPHLEELPPSLDAVTAGWHRFVERTWGRPEMKAPERWRPVAAALAEDVPADGRPLFEMGTGLREGGDAVVLGALSRAGEAFDYLDPRPFLPDAHCPLTFVHGRDDDVIPYHQAEKLRRAAPVRAEARALVTGMYAHTGSSGLGELVRELPVLLGELRAMVGILRATATAARGR